MTSKQIRWVLGTISTLGPVSTQGITVVEHCLPGQDLSLIDQARLHWPVVEGIKRRGDALDYFARLDGFASHQAQARAYGTAVDGMAIYKGVQL